MQLICSNQAMCRVQKAVTEFCLDCLECDLDPKPGCFFYPFSPFWREQGEAETEINPNQKEKPPCNRKKN